MAQVNGREIDNSCPFMGQCWANQGCVQECPPTHLDVLKSSARLEHELKMLPHTDPDLMAVCEVCSKRKPTRSFTGILTPNETREVEMTDGG